MASPARARRTAPRVNGQAEALHACTMSNHSDASAPGQGVAHRAVDRSVPVPASPSLVSLDHAKDWAKRLLKGAPSAPIATLAHAQDAVAHMLGHASWHALSQFYRPQATAPSDGPAADFDAWSEATLGVLNAAYPGLGAVTVESLATDTVEGELDATTLQDRARDLQNEGYFHDDAFHLAVEQLSVPVKAPPGHLLVRVRNAQGDAYLVTLDSRTYRARLASTRPRR